MGLAISSWGRQHAGSVEAVGRAVEAAARSLPVAVHAGAACNAVSKNVTIVSSVQRRLLG